MLGLGRKQGESIRIGDDITVHISEIKRGSVSILIDAPRDISIVRSELRPKEEAAVAPGPGEGSDAKSAPAGG